MSAPARPLPCGLSARLKSEREAYRRELSQLQLALAKAQGENLELRRRLAGHED